MSVQMKTSLVGMVSALITFSLRRVANNAAFNSSLGLKQIDVLHHCRSCFWKSGLIVTSGFLCEVSSCEEIPSSEDVSGVLVRYHIVCGIVPPQDSQ